MIDTLKWNKFFVLCIYNRYTDEFINLVFLTKLYYLTGLLDEWKKYELLQNAAF